MSDFEAQKVKKHMGPDGLGADGYVGVRECMHCATIQQEVEALNCICRHCGHKGHFVYAAKWINESKWWNPNTWGHGHWERVVIEGTGLQ